MAPIPSPVGLLPPVRSTNPITPLGHGTPPPLNFGQGVVSHPGPGAGGTLQGRRTDNLYGQAHAIDHNPLTTINAYGHHHHGVLDTIAQGTHSDPVALLREFLARQQGSPLHRMGVNPGGPMLPGPTTLGTNPLDILLAAAGGGGGSGPRPNLAS